MKAIIHHERGPASVLRYEEVADPVCAPDGILIRVEAVSIEGGDILNRWRNTPPQGGQVPGYQAAGEIIAVGAQVSHLAVGQKVATTHASGSHAELRAVPARNAWPIPDGFDVGEASVMPVTFGTADECLFEFGHLKAGQTVLIQAGASGVGVAAIQLARRAGARVIATASSDEKLQRLKAIGLEHGINYRRDSVPAAVMALTGGAGADLVLDTIGGSVLQGSIASLAYRGNVIVVGSFGREPMMIDASSLMAGDQSVRGVMTINSFIRDYPRIHATTQRLIDEAARGELQVLIDRRFPLHEAAAAHAYAESRQAVGRVLLIP